MIWYIVFTFAWFVSMHILCTVSIGQIEDNGWLDDPDRPQKTKDRWYFPWLTLLLCFTPVIRWILFGLIWYMATHHAD